MRKLIESNRLVLFMYGCLLLCLASYFVIREHRLPFLLDNDVPFQFLVRLGTFWFISMMIAVVIYLAHLSYNYLLLKEPDKALAKYAGLVTFWLGVTGSIILGMLLFLFKLYPAYFTGLF